jgi:hypothetical protein
MEYDPDSLLALFNLLLEKCPGFLEIVASQTDEQFDEGLEGILEMAANHLERNANHLVSLDEEAISAFLVAYLNMPGLCATQEAHSNGHVDITIEAEHSPPLRRRLGEAKIYNGPAYHVEGLEQLMNRYTTGREGTGLVVDYVKQQGIKDLVAKIRSHMDLEKPCVQDGNSQDHRIRWAFTTKHHHSSGEILRVLHLNCNLHRPDGSG